MLENPFWHALTTEQAGIAIGSGPARRYPADVIPFGGMEAATPEAMLALRELIATGETIYLTGDHVPAIPGIEYVGEMPGLQMHFPGEFEEIEEPCELRALDPSDVPAMVALTDAAFPGYFRARTYELGDYYGIHLDGELVAMAGERISLPGCREISAVCTHPSYTGRGYAAILIRHIRRSHSDQGVRSFLHVLESNERAIALYERLGFVKTRPMLFHRLCGV